MLPENRAEKLVEADEADAAADRLFQEIQEGRVTLKSFVTSDFERQPPQAAVAIGALRQHARRLRT